MSTYTTVNEETNVKCLRSGKAHWYQDKNRVTIYDFSVCRKIKIREGVSNLIMRTPGTGDWELPSWLIMA